MITPCKQCICAAICKNKLYFDLFNQCSILSKWRRSQFVTREELLDHQKFLEVLEYLIKDLKPNTWRVVMKEDRRTKELLRTLTCTISLNALGGSSGVS